MIINVNFLYSLFHSELDFPESFYMILALCPGFPFLFSGQREIERSTFTSAVLHTNMALMVFNQVFHYG